MSGYEAYSNGDYAHGHAVDFLDDAANEFYLTGVQLEIGEVATPFKYETFGENLARCQRYYYKPNTTGNLMGNLIAPDGNANDFIGQIAFPVEMRASPTYTGTPVENGSEDALGGMAANDTNAVGISYIRMTNDGSSARRGINVKGEVSAEFS